MALTKLNLLMVVAAIFAVNALIAKAAPVELQDENSGAPEDINDFARKFREQAAKNFEEFKKTAGFPIDVKNLPKDPNTHVYGESETAYHVASNIDGKKSEESGGHKVVNDDGKITEYNL